MDALPVARQNALIVERLGDEVLVFDENSSRGHCLSKDVARVWDACDGTRSPRDLSRECRIVAAQVELALAELGDANLLEAGSARCSRRDLSKKAAKVAIAAPIIYSLSVAPAAATPVACGQVQCTGGNQGQANDVCRANGNCRSTSTCVDGTGNPSATGVCKF